MSRIHDSLAAALGPREWRPAESPFEVILGAILAQNTAWENAAAAIENLRRNDLLRLDRICALGPREMEALIRPSGFYRQKAKKIKAFCDHVATKWDGSIEQLLRLEMESLRAELRSIRGIGPETADGIVLYAAFQPSFVVDVYTWRIFSRHGWVEESISYDDLRDYFMDALDPDVQLFQEFHALLVRIGRLYCRGKPRCQSCPLHVFFDQ